MCFFYIFHESFTISVVQKATYEQLNTCKDAILSLPSQSNLKSLHDFFSHEKYLNFSLTDLHGKINCISMLLLLLFIALRSFGGLTQYLCF